MLPAMLLIASAAAIPPDLGNWQTLQDGKMQISHATARDLPWAKCVTVLPGSMLQLVSLLKDHEGYPSWMDRVYETRIYDENMEIVLEMERCDPADLIRWGMAAYSTSLDLRPFIHLRCGHQPAIAMAVLKRGRDAFGESSQLRV